MKIKELSYFHHSLVRGDIVKTNLGFWAVIQRATSYDDVKDFFEYSIIEATKEYPIGAVPSMITKDYIIIAFEAAPLEDIKKSYPEYFL